MSRYLKDLHRSFKLKLQRVFFKGGTKRQFQEQIDVHRLFLFTSYHEQQQLGGRLPDGFTEHLIEQAKSMPFEQQHQLVHQQLNKQLVAIAHSLHSCLVQHQDPQPSATALEQAWQQMHPQQQHHSQHTTPNSSSSSPGQLLSQHQLSQLVQQQLGYSLAVRPSLITHQEAGMGLFVEGHVPPGALLALFPGLVYSKPVYRRMSGYPRIDVGNPYLTARYDGGIVDSLPWGRGWLADGKRASVPPVAPAPMGYISRLASASDGPRKPLPDTVWVRATTGEAAALEMLEGRHPLALAHFANHPPPGATPNTVIASFTFTPPGVQLKQQAALAAAAQLDSGSSAASSQGHAADANAVASASTGDTSSSGAHGGRACSDSSASNDACSKDVEPWVRAYVPNINYTGDCSPEHLLTHEVSCVGLVAVQALQPGTEVLFNYRLSPSLMGRPAWYVPVDSREENMRWA